MSWSPPRPGHSHARNYPVEKTISSERERLTVRRNGHDLAASSWFRLRYGAREPSSEAHFERVRPSWLQRLERGQAGGEIRPPFTQTSSNHLHSPSGIHVRRDGRGVWHRKEQSVARGGGGRRRCLKRLDAVIFNEAKTRESWSRI